MSTYFLRGILVLRVVYIVRLEGVELGVGYVVHFAFHDEALLLSSVA